MARPATASGLPADFAAILIRAKKHTYAGSDDDTTVAAPLLAGSMELGWREGAWSYRDIYFGMEAFTGLETVCHAEKPLWAMAYSGGLLPGVPAGDGATIYAFLRAALLALPEGFPVRGPARFADKPFEYRMQWTGDLSRFAGHEQVFLRRAGGLFSRLLGRSGPVEGRRATILRFPPDHPAAIPRAFAA